MTKVEVDPVVLSFSIGTIAIWCFTLGLIVGVRCL